MALGTRHTFLPTLARIIRSRPDHVLRPRTWLPSLRPSLTDTKSNQTQCLSTTAFSIKPSYRNSQLMAQTSMSVRQFAMLSPRSPQALGSGLEPKARCDVRTWRAMSEAKAGEAIEAGSTDYSSAKPFSSIPTPGSLSFLPYVGPLFMFKPFSSYTVYEVSHVISALHDRLGPIFRMRRGRDWMLCIDRLEDIENVLRTEDPTPYRSPIPIIDLHGRRSKILSVNLLNGQEWKRLRSPMNKLMNRPTSVTHYLPSQEQVAVDFADRLYQQQNSDPASLTELFFRFATERLCVCTLEIHSCYTTSVGIFHRFISNRCLKAYAQSLCASEVLSCVTLNARMEFAMAMKHLSGTSLFRGANQQMWRGVGVICFNKRLGFLAEHHELDGLSLKLLKSYKTSLSCIAQSLFGKRVLYLLYEDSFYKQYAEAKRVCLKFTTERINEVLEEVTTKRREGTFNPEDPNFLLSLLAEKSLDEKDVYSIIDALMTAGSDSTACSLQLLFYALATNKSKQDTLAEELMTHLGPDGHLNASSLDKLHYLKATVKESMRLYFPVPSGPTRFLPHYAVLSGYQVPKGTPVFPSNPRTAISERHYDQPKEFLPERWLRDKGGHRARDISMLTYLPFGVGARNCVGRRFALQELYLATTKVLQKYEIGLKEDSPPLEIIHTPFCVPKHGIHFTFTPRH